MDREEKQRITLDVRKVVEQLCAGSAVLQQFLSELERTSQK